jgi:hypothetical protein
MQTHICRTLAHHMVYLGTRLNLPISSAMERFILDAAESMWNKEGHFIWKFNWETANAESDTDDGDKQQEEPSIDHDYLELDVEKWPVYFTEAYYSGDGRGPQESDSSAGFGEFPFSNLPVIEDMRILEHLNHGAALNAPSLDKSTSQALVSSLLGPELAAAGWFLPAQGSPHFVFQATCSSGLIANKPHVLHSLQRFVPSWLLV